MPAKKKKTKKVAPKKQLKALTRKAIIGWLAAIFIACGWMFALGVLVGRDQAPIEFDVDALEKQITKLRQKESVTNNHGNSKKNGAPREKNQLDFYEALPENREDTKIPGKPKSKSGTSRSKTSAGVSQPHKKPDSPKLPDKQSTASDGKAAKAPPKIAAADVKKGSFTIQVSSVKNKPDADRLVRKLTKRGYPAYLLTSQIPGKGTWHRVRIGSYAGKDKAQPVLNELRRTGMKPILVKTK